MGIKSNNPTESYFNFFSESGVLKKKAVLSATGGSTIQPGNGYKYHVFTGPGTFSITPATIPAVPTGTYEVLIVAGGGCGGFSADSVSGGGGAGGIVYYTGYPLPAGDLSLIHI